MLDIRYQALQKLMFPKATVPNLHYFDQHVISSNNDN